MLSFRFVLPSNNGVLFHRVLRCQQPSLCLSRHRSFVTKRRPQRQRGRPQRRTRPENRAKKDNPHSSQEEDASSTSFFRRSTRKHGWSDRSSWFVPYRYWSTGSAYTREQLSAIAQRLPLWLVLVVYFSWEETSPYSFLKISGPSMIPSMAADMSEIWLRSTVTWRRKLNRLVGRQIFLKNYYRVQDIVGFAHPDFPRHVSCKRIVGMPGDTVRRYGEYVHLYIHQDPDEFGRTWPRDELRPWIDRDWDMQDRLPDRKREAFRTIVVPPGHVWLEADCPGLGIDSRHFGPVPMEWLRGKIKRRIWPLWKKREDGEAFVSYKTRPHPIPLDEETLRFHNVHMAWS